MSDAMKLQKLFNSAHRIMQRDDIDLHDVFGDGTHLVSKDNILAEYHINCFECGLPLSHKVLIGGQTGQKIDQTKECQYQLCHGCIKNYCETQVLRRKKQDALWDDLPEPEYCDCEKCKE